MSFAADVRTGLTRQPRQLHPKYLYDGLGSSLFEAICRLPWYRVTRSECALLTRHAPAIIAGLDSGTLIELGCGNGDKLLVLAEALVQRGGAARVHLVDISRQALEKSRALLEHTQLPVVTHETTYEAGLNAAARTQKAGRTLVLFLGSNIGNFDRPDAEIFLTDIRSTLKPGDALLLGADLVKPEHELVVAYDDPLGVTAAFNRNLLVRINSELDGDFDLDAFRHRALWNSTESRVEMHLVSARRQRVTIAGADITVEFGEGESIWTESSYKYEPEQIVEMGHGAGFAARDQWIDLEARFALTLLEARTTGRA